MFFFRCRAMNEKDLGEYDKALTHGGLIDSAAPSERTFSGATQSTGCASLHP